MFPTIDLALLLLLLLLLVVSSSSSSFSLSYSSSLREQPKSSSSSSVLFEQAAHVVSASLVDGDAFGLAVALCADRYLLVGAPLATVDTGNGTLQGGGAAFLFDCPTPDTCRQIAQLTAADEEEEEAMAGDDFGWSVAFFVDDSDSGSSSSYQEQNCPCCRMAVGAPSKTVGNATSQGAVYVFDCDLNDGANGDGIGVNCTQRMPTLIDEVNGGANDLFGHSLAASANPDTLYIGTPRPQGIGSVSVARCNDTHCHVDYSATMVGDIDDEDHFGAHVAVSGSALVVGAMGGRNHSGVAYVVDLRTGNRTCIAANDAQPYDHFGGSVAIDGTTVAVGAFLAAVDGRAHQGRVYVFDCTYGSTDVVCTEFANVTAADGASFDRFGRSSAFLGGTLLVGADNKTIDDDVASQGAAYLFNCSVAAGCQQTQRIVAEDGAADSTFGRSVVLGSASLLVVGSAAAMQGGAFVFVACPPGTFGATCVPCASCVSADSCAEGIDGGCNCTAGWNGTLCDACATNYYGADCAPCSVNCSGHGVCDDGLDGNGTCDCDTGYEGDDCSVANCHAIGCNDHGECLESGDCECDAAWNGTFCDACASNYYGATCSPCTVDCSGNGVCDDGLDGNGTCLCNVAWNGTACDQCATNYYGPACTPCTVDCSGHGVCDDGIDGNGTCNCNVGYDGDDCSIPNCQELGCNDHGECLESGMCNCTVVGWNGTFCDECASNYFGSTCAPCAVDCSGNGACNDGLEGDGTCECNPGYEEDDCSVANCIIEGCNSHGECLESGDCECDAAWNGTFCDACASNYYGPTCTACTVDCSGNGVCNDGLDGDGTCECNPGYEEDDCSVANCIIEGCNSHGECLESGDCECDAAWNGTFCNQCASGHYGMECTECAVDCNGHGVCNDGVTGDGSCYCSPGYEGDYCEEENCLANHCNGHGVCQLSGECECASGWRGEFCDVNQKLRVITGIVILLLLVSIVLYGIARWKSAEAENGVIFSLTLSILNVITDVVFVIALSENCLKENIYRAAAAFLLLTLIANIVLVPWFLRRMLRDSRDWFSDHWLLVSLVSVISLADVESLSLLHSGLFGLEMLSPGWTYEDVTLLSHLGLVPLLLEDLPMIAIGAAVIHNNMDSRPPLANLAIVTVIVSCLSVLFAVSLRFFRRAASRGGYKTGEHIPLVT